MTGDETVIVPLDVGFCSTSIVAESGSSKLVVVELVAIGVIVSAGGVVAAEKVVHSKIVIILLIDGNLGQASRVPAEFSEEVSI